MGWTEGHANGFALAAIVANDRDLSWASAYVDHTLVASATARVRTVRRADNKRQALQDLVNQVRCVHDRAVPPAASQSLRQRAARAPEEHARARAEADLAAILQRAERHCGARR